MEGTVGGGGLVVTNGAVVAFSSLPLHATSRNINPAEKKIVIFLALPNIY
jgi:hypothetical protein